MKGRLKNIFQTAFLLLGGGWVFVFEHIRSANSGYSAAVSCFTNC